MLLNFNISIKKEFLRIRFNTEFIQVKKYLC